MPSNTQITFVQGQTYKMRFDMQNEDGTPIDITNVGFTGSIKETYSSINPSVMFTIEKISPETSGSFYVIIPSGSTSGLSTQDYFYDILMVSGSEVYPVVEGKVIIRPGITFTEL